jgi:hypothetical protein
MTGAHTTLGRVSEKKRYVQISSLIWELSVDRDALR